MCRRGRLGSVAAVNRLLSHALLQCLAAEPPWLASATQYRERICASGCGCDTPSVAARSAVRNVAGRAGYSRFAECEAAVDAQLEPPFAAQPGRGGQQKCCVRGLNEAANSQVEGLKPRPGAIFLH